MRTNNPLKLGYILGATSGFLWAINTLLLGAIVSKEPFTTSAVLLLSGSIVCSFFHDAFAAFWLSCFMLVKKKLKTMKELFKLKDTRFLVLGALLGGPIGMTCYVLAIETAGATKTAMITSTYPVLSILLAILLLKEKVNTLAKGGILLTLIGVFYLTYSPLSEGVEATSLYKGMAFAFLAAIGWASESVICAYGMKSDKIDPDMALTIRELTSFIAYFALVVPLFCGTYSGVIEVMKSSSVLLLLFTALLGVSSYLCWYKSINIIGAAKAVTLNITYSFWTVLLSALFLEQELVLKDIVCCILIVIGVLLTAKSEEKQELKKQTNMN